MKMENNKSKRNRKTLVIIISLISLALLIAVPISYAVFTGSSFTQRTIGAYAASGDNFSSNYLRKGNEDNVIVVYTTSKSIGASTYMTICNYPQGKQTLFSNTDISYTITASLVKLDNNDEYVNATSADFTDSSDVSKHYTVAITTSDEPLTLGYNNGSNTVSATYSSTLEGGSAISNSFEILFDSNFTNDDNPNLYLSIVATTPNDANLPTISGIFKPAYRAPGAVNTWTGVFRDDKSKPASDYDGFNYLISGVGEGTVVLRWKNDLELSYVSLKLLQGITTSQVVTNGTNKSITFQVNSDDIDRLELQFYKTVNSTSFVWSNNDELLDVDGNQIVEFSFTPSN